MRATACMVSCAPPQASALCWRAGWEAISLPVSSLGWAEEALKRHARRSDGDADIIEVFGYPLFSVTALGCRGTWRSSWWQNWAYDRHDLFWGANPGVCCAMICSRERGCCPGRHSLRFTIYPLGGGCRWCPHGVLATDRLGDVGRVRTCHHESWMKSSNSNRTPPPRACIYPGITRTLNFCEFCTTLIPVQRTSASSVRHSYPYPELVWVLYAPCHNTRGTGTTFLVRTRNFCEFCTPVPQYPELLWVLQHFHTRTRNFCKFCKTPIPLPGNHKPYRT